MDLDQLVAFERVVREGSFSRAAYSLHIAQPTLSARIQALERAVGGPLFSRSHRKISLTERGANFLPYARRALEVLNDGVEAVRQAQSGARGRMAIGALHSLTGGFIAPALAEFQRRYPQVQCLVEDGNHEHVIEMLSDGAVEIGFVTWPCIHPPMADLVPLLHLHEPVVLVASAKHPLAKLAKRRKIALSDVEAFGNPFMLLRWWEVTPVNLSHIALRAKTMVDVPMDTGRHLLRHSEAVGFFTRAYIHAELAVGDVVELPISDLPMLYRDSALVRLARNETLSAAASQFVGLLQARAKALKIAQLFA